MNFVYDDGGRSKTYLSGTKCRDCVVRAVAIATELPYMEVYEALSAGCRSERLTKGSRKESAANGVHTNRVWFKRYMQAMGWKWTPTMGIGTGCRVHLRDGELPMGRLIVSVSRHMVAVIDGVIRDTHDCTRGGNRCVYGYWSKA